MAKDTTKQEQKMWRDQAREIVRKAKTRTGKDGWDFVGASVQDAIVDSEFMSVVLGWASMAVVRKDDGGTERHMGECIVALRRAVVTEMAQERGEE